MHKNGENDENGMNLNFNYEKGISAYPKKLRDIQLFLFLWINEGSWTR